MGPWRGTVSQASGPEKPLGRDRRALLKRRVGGCPAFCVPAEGALRRGLRRFKRIHCPDFLAAKRMLNATRPTVLRAVWTGGLLLPLLCACPADEPADADTDPATTGVTEDTDASVCPTHLRLDRVASLSRASFGYTGLGHGASPSIGGTLTVELFDCDEDCRRCRFEGVVDNAPGIVTSKRCLISFDECTTDADCPGEDGPCRYLLRNASQANSAGWTMIWARPLTPDEQVRLGVDSDAPVQGVANLETGEIDFTVFNGQVNGGVGSVEHCLNDPTPDDGEKGGTCADSGLPCDVHALSALAPASFDCEYPPTITSFALPQHGSASSGRVWRMDETRPFCTRSGLEDQHCWCGVCADDPLLPCTRDSECPTGTCGTADGPTDVPVVTAQSGCAQGEVCNWNPETLLGSCLDASGQETACMPADGEFSVNGSTAVQDGFFVTQVALLSCVPQIEPDGAFGLDALYGFPGPIVQIQAYRGVPEFR